MSEVMTQAIIGMTYEMAMADELSSRQFHGRAQGLLADYAALEAECNALRQQLADMRKRAKKAEMDAHQALKTYKGLEKVANVVSDHSDQVCGELNIMHQQRDKLAGLLRDISSSESRGLDWAKKIDTALAELNP